MTSLRFRLLLSYGLILSVTLAVISVALVIVLRSRPVPTDELSARLAAMMSAVREEQGLATLPERGPTRLQERLLTVLARQARLRNFNVRILIVNGTTGVVAFDSSNDALGATLRLQGEPYAPPDVAETGIDTRAMRRGGYTEPDGTEWRYLAQPAALDAPTAWVYVLALRAPRQLSLRDFFAYYGEDLLIPLFQAGLIGLLVASVMAVLIARSVAHPLQEVARAVGRVAGGDWSARAPVRGVREVRVVAEAFNQMTEQVAIGEQAQREFLANVTHDLRTPLTSIQGFSQAIIDGVVANPDAAQHAAQIIHDEAGRLNRMVEELLDLARIEAGRWNMTRHTLQPEEILTVVKDRLTPKAAAKRVRFSLQTTPLPPIAGDGDRLVQVFTNLADNALKHTPEGGAVVIRAIYANLGVQIQFIDTGEGIPPDDIPHIFDRFYQVDKSRQRGQREGVGLGLTITKGIVEAHGGTIAVESTLGKGTIFTVWLPAPTADATTILRRRSLAPKRTGDKGR